ncbi:MAG: ABC-F family ATP-binding cassette domain-containing protein [Clostridia bacterium]|nr:ABC-F family ATP-binding cassette domain-containing protein [Clostridia bacterium]
MSIIVCDGVRYEIGVKAILSGVTFAVEAGSKVGIIGVNGAGKSTLLSLITREKEPTGGQIFIKKNTTIGCLEQINDSRVFSGSILDTALEAFSGLTALEEKLEVLREQASGGDETAAARYAEAQETFFSSGGNEYRAKAVALLRKFGFGPEELDSPASVLSGGQKTKLLLARLLLSEPDVLLLDEPTNHLDIAAVEWLEQFVRSSKKTFLIVSHDRYFLDRVTTDTVEIEHGEAKMYSGGYSVFKEKKNKLREDQQKHYDLQQKEIARIEAFIANQRKWNRERNIIAAESREKALARMVRVEKPQDLPRGISFRIAPASTRSHEVLSVRSLRKSFGKEHLFSNLSFEMHLGDRLFVIGPNGTGKSTLLRILTGRESADSGIYELGYSQSVGYYDQEQQLLDPANTVLEELWSVYAEKTMTEVRSMLASFGFRGEDVYKSVSVLSGGERARLSIAKMISCGVSLLILDEPTNHLDIDSRETLEEALKGYGGTILAVSHDRYFIRSLATNILVLDRKNDTGLFPDGYRLYRCGYEEYLRRAESERAQNGQEQSADSPSGSKLSFEEQKKRKNRQRIASARFEAVEKEIGLAEAELASLQAEAADESIAADYVKLGELAARAEETEQRIAALYAEYEALDRELAAFGSPSENAE